jgi:hypothetical protein
MNRLIQHIFYRISERAVRSQVLPLRSRPTSLMDGDAGCVGEFRTTFRTIPAPLRRVRNY